MEPTAEDSPGKGADSDVHRAGSAVLSAGGRWRLLGEGLAVLAWVMLAAWCMVTLTRVGDLRARVDRDVRWLRDAEVYRRDLDSLVAAASRTSGRTLSDPETRRSARELLGSRTHDLLDRIPPGEAEPEAQRLWRESAARLESAIDSVEGSGGIGDLAVLRDASTHAAEMGLALSRSIVEVRGGVTGPLEILGVRWWTLYALAFVLLLSTGLLLLALSRARRQEARLRAHDQALAEQERRYRQMFVGNPAVQLLVDPEDGSLVAVNPAAEAFYGYSAEELRGMRISDLNTLPEEEIRRALDQARASNRRFEFRHRLRSGEVRDVEVRTGPIEVEGRTLLYSIVHDVTERRRAYESLRASEQRLALVVDHLPAAVWTTDRDLRITASLGGGLAQLGLRPDQAVGQTIPEYLGLEDPGAPSLVAHREALDGRGSGYETGWNGRFYRCELRPLHRADGTVAGTIGLALDITELRVAEERYRNIFENTVEGIFQVRRDGHVLAANPSLVRMLGYADEDDMRTSLTDIARQHYVEPGTRERWQERLDRDGVVHGFEYEARRKDGGTVWLSENVRAVRAADGSVDYYEGTVEDITVRRRAAEEVARLQRFYGEILDKLPASVSVLRPDGTVRYVNPAAVRDPARRTWIIGRTDADYAAAVGIDPAAVEQRRLALEKCIAEKRLVALEEEVGLAGMEPRHFLRLHSPVLDGDGTVRMVIRYGIDVTERRHLEENLRQSSKMEAVGRLAGGVAHDFNNILTVITGYSDMLLASLPEGDHRRMPALEVRAAAERATALTGQLLTFSRKRVVNPRTLRVDEALQRLLPLVRRLIGEDIELEVAIGSDACVLVDEGQWTQILMNLAVNARDAMPRGGRLRIAHRSVEVGAPPAQGSWPPPGSWEVLDVTDSGEGIPAHHLDRVFEPFFTTKPGGRGVGLGLATVHGIVGEAGGHIRVRSRPGEGTTFELALPSVAGSPAKESEGAASTEPEARHEVVLVAEDEDPIRNLVATCLRNAGYTVLTAPDGVAALELAAAHDGPIDLLLTDVVMPRMGGGDLSVRIREHHPDIRVLLMSGYTDDTLVHHGVSHQDLGFIQKPFRPAELLRAMRRVLEGVR